MGRAREFWEPLVTCGLVGLGLSVAAPAAASEAEIWHHLPENTPLVMLVDTTADTWGQLSQYQLFNLLEREQGLLPGLPGLPYLPYGIDFAADVAPWVGDTVVLALLPVEPDALAFFSDHAVMVVPARDPAGLADFQATVLDLQGEAEEVVNALGTDIYVWAAPDYGNWEDWEDWEDYDGPWIDCEVEPEQCYQQFQPRRVAPPALRLGSGVGLPLTVQSFPKGDVDPEGAELDPEGAELDPEGDGFDLEVPLPLPTFGPGGLAIAFLPDAVVAAETPGAIEQYLALRQQNGPALATSREFQRTLAQRTENRALFALYGNALELLNFDPTPALLGPGLPVPVPVPPLDPSTIQTLRAFNFSGTLEALVYPGPTGLQAQGRYYYDLMPFTFGSTPALPEADSLLQLLPASTLVMVSGRNVAGFWQGLSQVLESASELTSEGLAAARSFFTLATGLDLDRDVFGWMDGEVAVAAFPTRGGPLRVLGLGLLVQTSDRPTAENTLAAVDNLLPNFGLIPHQRLVNSQPATSWELSWGEDEGDYVYIPELSLGSHSWLTDNTLALTSGAVPMGRLLAPSAHDPLGDFFLFRQATAPFPRPNNGYFYLNVGATLSLVYQVFGLHGDPFVEELKPYLSSVRSLSATSTQNPSYVEVRGQLGLAHRRN